MLDQYEIIKKFTLIVERYPYQQVLEYIKTLAKQQPDQLLIIEEAVYDYHLLSQLTGHKVSLTKILTETSGVVALPEDRTRILFLLVKFADANLPAVNQAFKQEFGPYFNIYGEYRIGEKRKTWRELARRAAEIKNGYKNFDLLVTKVIADLIAEFYRIYDVKEPEKLAKILDLSHRILVKSAKDNVTDFRIADIPELKGYASELYKLVERVPLDIKELDQDVRIGKVNEFVFLIKYATMARLDLISLKKPIDDFATVEKLVGEYFAQKFSLRYRRDEFSRIHQKLEPIKKRIG
jgi:hypothetical protein